jgi:hypothetical protein
MTWWMWVLAALYVMVAGVDGHVRGAQHKTAPIASAIFAPFWPIIWVLTFAASFIIVIFKGAK